MCRTATTAWAIVLAFFAVAPGLAQSDTEGAKDHPLFTRMKDFYITSYEVKEYDSQEFKNSQGADLTVEGKTTIIEYYLKEGAREITPIQIIRNFENAVKKAGGTFFEYGDHTAFLNLKKGESEIWAAVNATAESYLLTITEKKALEQEVTASDMLDALNAGGFIALDIHFDTDKATIKPESQAIVEQIAALLKENPGLKVSIEGHTDGTGTAERNRALSRERAEAVRAAVAAQGVPAGRMEAKGWGPDKPVADNRTEEGKAKNRRVEIVKR